MILEIVQVCTEFIKRTNEFLSDFTRLVAADDVATPVKLTKDFEKGVLKGLSTGQVDLRVVDDFENDWL